MTPVTKDNLIEQGEFIFVKLPKFKVIYYIDDPRMYLPYKSDSDIKRVVRELTKELESDTYSKDSKLWVDEDNELHHYSITKRTYATLSKSNGKWKLDSIKDYTDDEVERLRNNFKPTNVIENKKFIELD